MAYATLADFKERLGSNVSPPGLYEQLTDRINGTTGNDTVGQAILDGANGTLNYYIKSSPRGYAVPVDVSSDATLAQFLKKAVLRVAEFDAWQGHSMRKGMPSRVSDGYRETKELFEQIAAGTGNLPGAAAVAVSDAYSAKRGGPDRKFSLDIYE